MQISTPVSAVVSREAQPLAKLVGVTPPPDENISSHVQIHTNTAVNTPMIGGGRRGGGPTSHIPVHLYGHIVDLQVLVGTDVRVFSVSFGVP